MSLDFCKFRGTVAKSSQSFSVFTYVKEFNDANRLKKLLANVDLTQSVEGRAYTSSTRIGLTKHNPLANNISLISVLVIV